MREILRSSKAATFYGVPLGIASYCFSSAEAFPTLGIRVQRYKDVFFYDFYATPVLKQRFSVKYMVFIFIIIL